jgi:hypothetical protein
MVPTLAVAPLLLLASIITIAEATGSSQLTELRPESADDPATEAAVSPRKCITGLRSPADDAWRFIHVAEAEDD